MAKRPTVATLASGFRSASKLNENFEEIAGQFDNTVSRDGSYPNFMTADFDLNGYRLLNLPAPGAPTDPVRFMDITDGIGLGSLFYSDATVGPVPVSFSTLIATQHINVRSFGVMGDDTDETEKIQEAYDAALASGLNLYFPPGTYRSGHIAASQAVPVGVFGQGIKVFGASPVLTTFNSTAADGAIFDVTTETPFKFLLGVEFTNFGIKSANGAANSTGIRLRSAYNVRLTQLWIRGLSDDGINITCEAGDSDASNMVYMEHVRVDTCARWGIDATSGVGSNEISFVTGYNVFVQGCGTVSAAYPPESGGIRAKNQIFTLRSCGFTINKNVGVFLSGGAGAPNSATIDQCAVENNGKYSLLITGGQGIKVTNTQFYSEDVQNPETATNGVLIDGSTYLIENVEIDTPIVRIASNVTPFTMFKLQGSNIRRDTVRVRNVSWIGFDYAGQVRFDNVPFDFVPENCGVIVASATNVRLRADTTKGQGNSTPHRKSAGVGGISTSGEIVALNVEGFGGIQISNSGLANNTVYNVYLYDNAAVPTLELSTTDYDLDPIDNYHFKLGDRTRLWKGRVSTNGSGQFVTSSIGYLNPLRIDTDSVGLPGHLWVNTADKRLYIKTGTAFPTFGSAGEIAFTPDTETVIAAVDPASVAAGASLGIDLTVTCNNNDHVTSVSRLGGWGGLIAVGCVKAANTVTLGLINPTGAPIDLSAANVYVKLERR